MTKMSISFVYSFTNNSSRKPTIFTLLWRWREGFGWKSSALVNFISILNKYLKFFNDSHKASIDNIPLITLIRFIRVGNLKLHKYWALVMFIPLFQYCCCCCCRWCMPIPLYATIIITLLRVNNNQWLVNMKVKDASNALTFSQWFNQISSVFQYLLYHIVIIDGDIIINSIWWKRHEADTILLLTDDAIHNKIWSIFNQSKIKFNIEQITYEIWLPLGF